MAALGQVNNQFQANLGQNAAMNQGNQAAIQQQQTGDGGAAGAARCVVWPQGFGGQTAYYAGLGADYGRATGGFGGYGGMNDRPLRRGCTRPILPISGGSGSGRSR